RGTVALVDEDPARPAALDEFEAEAALADSWIGNDADDLTAASKCPLERSLEHRHLAIPPDELREPSRTRDLEVCLQSADPLKLVDAERLLHPLDGKLPEVLKAPQPFDQLRRVLAEIRLAGLGDLLHSRPEARGVTER